MIHSARSSTIWVVEAVGSWGNRNRALAGLALAVAAGVGLAATLATRSGAALVSQGVTVPVPPPAKDRIFGALAARGRPIVVIDPGHGGNDPGASGVSGDVREKDLTLVLARDLRDQLVKRGRVRVAMTRDEDRTIELDQRSAVARRLNAAMFVSLHLDSAPNPLARGASVYSLSDVASDAEAARLAVKENRGSASNDLGAGSANSLLADLAMRSQMSASADLAARFLSRAAGRIGLRPNPHRFAAFHVLRRAEAPAILFEGGYLSNADDELQLRDPAHRARIVLALAQAIETDVAARAR